MLHKLLKLQSKTNYSDLEYVIGLKNHDRKMEELFYNQMKGYFMSRFNEVFFDKDRKQEIFQDSFVRLWTDIRNGKINIEKENIVRQHKDGVFRMMTCNLSTFLMAIAKNEYRELIRNSKELLVSEFYDNDSNSEAMLTSFDIEEDQKNFKARLVDNIIKEMSPRCIEILTLFYYEGKSLDEIMIIREDKNTTKTGLKTAKYKCMTTLKERVAEQFNKFNLTV